MPSSSRSQRPATGAAAGGRLTASAMAESRIGYALTPLQPKCHTRGVGEAKLLSRSTLVEARTGRRFAPGSTWYCEAARSRPVGYPRGGRAAQSRPGARSNTTRGLQLHVEAATSGRYALLPALRGRKSGGGSRRRPCRVSGGPCAAAATLPVSLSHGERGGRGLRCGTLASQAAQVPARERVCLHGASHPRPSASGVPWRLSPIRQSRRGSLASWRRRPAPAGAQRAAGSGQRGGPTPCLCAGGAPQRGGLTPCLCAGGAPQRSSSHPATPAAFERFWYPVGGGHGAALGPYGYPGAHSPGYAGGPAAAAG